MYSAIRYVLVALFCYVAFGAWGAVQAALPQYNGPEENEGGSVICFRDEGATAYIIDAPEGWVTEAENDPDGPCVYFFQKGKAFEEAPAVIFPQLLPARQVEDPVAAEVEFSQGLLRKQGGMGVVRAGDNIVFGENEKRMVWKMRYFEDLPLRYKQQLVAYHEGKGVLLLLVLSGLTKEDLAAHEPALRASMASVLPMKLQRANAASQKNGSVPVEAAPVPGESARNKKNRMP
ncbi:hypothetical protein [Desulfovibrio cuneatus]|uniref:hypothetical protein n=1 Tax=Desulfovibrio cuneatus TaxID=159728 RepID=UPI00040F4129|nr:hypothetical protein [Desulfovibrio cuneatus]